MYYDILDQLEDFSDEQFGKMTRAILTYDKFGTIPEFDDAEVKIAFKMLKPMIDKNKQEYEEVCAKRREAGSLGGKQKVANASKCYQELANLADNDNDKEKDNDIKKENNKKKEIFDFWNLKNIIQHKKLTEDTEKSIEKALKQYTEEEIKTYIDRYNRVIKDKSFFFDYKWTLKEFLSRKDGISSFCDDGSKWQNYLQSRKGKTPYSEANQKYLEENRKYLSRNDTELF